MSQWKPDDKTAMETMIRVAIKAAGGSSENDLPSKVKQQLAGQLEGRDVDATIKDVIAEMKRKGEL